MVAFFTCDGCGGPASWCLDRAGDVWQLCEDVSCMTRLQLTLFPEEPIWEEGVPVLREGSEPRDARRT